MTEATLLASEQITDPAGWKLVPIEPTQEMIDAWASASVPAFLVAACPDDEANRIVATNDWKAMLSASPAPSGQPGIRINGQPATADDVIAIGRAMDAEDGGYPAPSGQGVSGEVAHGMDSAPKDGTMIRLLVDYTDGGGPLDDALVAWTIGFNDLDGTGVDEWKFAGWCWTHDHFSQGSGTPVGWLPWSNPSAGGDAK